MVNDVVREYMLDNGFCFLTGLWLPRDMEHPYAALVLFPRAEVHVYSNSIGNEVWFQTEAGGLILNGEYVFRHAISTISREGFITRSSKLFECKTFNPDESFYTQVLDYLRGIVHGLRAAVYLPQLEFV